MWTCTGKDTELLHSWRCRASPNTCCWRAFLFQAASHTSQLGATSVSPVRIPSLLPASISKAPVPHHHASHHPLCTCLKSGALQMLSTTTSHRSPFRPTKLRAGQRTISGKSGLKNAVPLRAASCAVVCFNILSSHSGQPFTAWHLPGHIQGSHTQSHHCYQREVALHMHKFRSTGRGT